MLLTQPARLTWCPRSNLYRPITTSPNLHREYSNSGNKEEKASTEAFQLHTSSEQQFHECSPDQSSHGIDYADRKGIGVHAGTHQPRAIQGKQEKGLLADGGLCDKHLLRPGFLNVLKCQ